MSVVYRVGSYYGTEYFGTVKEARKHKPGGEEPEEFLCLDATAECNRLHRYCETTEDLLGRAVYLLDQLLMESSPDLIGSTELGREVSKFLEANPPSPATSAERDGSRSYGV